MFRICLHVVSTVGLQYLERSLILVRPTSASDSPMHTMKFGSVVFGLYPSTDVRAWLGVINKTRLTDAGRQTTDEFATTQGERNVVT